MNSKEYVKIEYKKQDGSTEEVVVDVVKKDTMLISSITTPSVVTTPLATFDTLL